MQIAYLADHPDFIPTLAQWHQAQFGYLSPRTTVEQRVHMIPPETTAIKASRLGTMAGTLGGIALAARAGSVD